VSTIEHTTRNLHVGHVNIKLLIKNRIQIILDISSLYQTVILQICIDIGIRLVFFVWLEEVTNSVEIPKVPTLDDFDVKKPVEEDGRRGFRGEDFVFQFVFGMLCLAFDVTRNFHFGFQIWQRSARYSIVDASTASTR
jgi:hypothetical protein